MDLKLTPIYDGANFLYHDITFTNGKLDTVDGIEEIGNRITIGLSTYLGESFTNTNYGTDYYNNVFGRDVSDTVAIDELKEQIINCRGVTGLKSFELNRQPGSRTAALTAQIETSEGEINIVTEVNV